MRLITFGLSSVDNDLGRKLQSSFSTEPSQLRLPGAQKNAEGTHQGRAFQSCFAEVGKREVVGFKMKRIWTVFLKSLVV